MSTQKCVYMNGFCLHTFVHMHRRFLLSWSLQWWSSCLTPEISTLMTPTSIITTKASDKTFSNVFDQKGDLFHRTSHQLIHLLHITKYLLPPNQLLFWFSVPFRKDTQHHSESSKHGTFITLLTLCFWSTCAILFEKLSIWALSLCDLFVCIYKNRGVLCVHLLGDFFF